MGDAFRNLVRGIEDQNRISWMVLTPVRTSALSTSLLPTSGSSLQTNTPAAALSLLSTSTIHHSQLQSLVHLYCRSFLPSI